MTNGCEEIVLAARKSLPAYHVYGVSVRSRWRLPGSPAAGHAVAEVEVVEEAAALCCAGVRASRRPTRGAAWFRHLRLNDGSTYLRWSGLFEFLVSADGRRIAARALNGISPEVFQTYLLGQVLSFALLKQGIEPLHATAVVVEGRAVAFLGDCGSGKSSLGAAFLRAGHQLLTDDLLVLEPQGGGFLAHAGPPRLKLFPRVARALLGPRARGLPMNPRTSKWVIPLGRGFCAPATAPLAAIYVLRPSSTGRPSAKVMVRALRPRRAAVELLANTFNCAIVEPERLKQQLDWAAQLARNIPVKSLFYPRRLARLPGVVEAIRADLNALPH